VQDDDPATSLTQLSLQPGQRFLRRITFPVMRIDIGADGRHAVLAQPHKKFRRVFQVRKPEQA